MKILIDPSGYNLTNHGDAAMTFTALARLRAALPDAELSIINVDADALLARDPKLHIVPPASRRAALQGFLPARVRRVLPFSRAVLLAEQTYGTVHPSLLARVTRKGDPRPYLNALLSADAVVFPGAGSINDAFADHAISMFDEMALAGERGIPCYLFGQGVGPIAKQSALEFAAERAVPAIKHASVRERLMSPDTLERLGMSPRAIELTGDDAVEMAHRRSPSTLGGYIGVNLRVASYAQTGAGLVEEIRPALQSAARKLRAPLTPVPISLRKGESDLDAAATLMDGSGCPVPPASAFATPEDVIDAAGRCRVVLAGSYHAAVFALSQGVPVVAISQSPYYDSKLAGLLDMFHDQRSRLLTVGRNFSAAALAEAIEGAWESAPAARQPLLERAVSQIAASREAWSWFPEAARRAA